MRRIIVAAFVSLDGMIQGPGGPSEDTDGGFALGGWVVPYVDEAFGTAMSELFAQPFELLLGRRTYDIFAAHWPFVPEGDELGQLFRTITKYVVTSSDAPLEWAGSRRLADIDAVAALKEEDGPNLVIQGSSTLYPPLLRRGLIDQLILMTAPVVLGGGKRLFGEGTGAGAWKLAEQRQSPGGILLSTYQPDDDVKIADFQLPDPTPQELARQERMRAGTW